MAEHGTLYVNFKSLDDAISAVCCSLPAPLGNDGFMTLGKRSIRLKVTFDDRYVENMHFGMLITY